ncbi:hypothetical protein lbkm_2541 [Lachnospiraceae bacterium KM106-2]|nr:hypothetical protein lbkm_2541 [Lachnospiraceae bacterium KM106-2]
MKKLVKKVLCIMLCLSMTVAIAGCGSKKTSKSGDGKLDMSKKVKIGVLVSDTTTAEALSFRKYYVDYIQKQYNVEFVYSDQMKDAAGEKSALDTFITNNCKAVISFSSFDRASQLEQCEKAKVYYAVATGTLTQKEYDKYKKYEYYVGAVGPSLELEYQTGYDMAKHYLDKGDENFAIFGGALPYYTEMHIYRVAGMLTAMIEAGGKDANYDGAKTKDEVIAKLFKAGSVSTGSIGTIQVLGYVGGYDMDDAWNAKCKQMVQTKGLQILLAVGNGSDFFGAAAAKAGVKVASVDAYAKNYGDAMQGKMLDYMAGKFSASIGPIFIATYRATLGAPLHNDKGEAIALDQGYWVAQNNDEFQKYYKVDSSIEKPAYTKKMLDKLLKADYKTFKEFVEKYKYEDIQTIGE